MSPSKRQSARPSKIVVAFLGRKSFLESLREAFRSTLCEPPVYLLADTITPEMITQSIYIDKHLFFIRPRACD